MSLPNLAVLDTDGAIQEAEAAVAGDTRASFFRKAAVGGGAVLGSSAIMGMLPEIASAKPSKKHDIAILNFALTLEYLEAEFYKQSISNGGLSGDALELAKLLADHETTHATTLRRTIRSLKGKTVKKPTFDFGNTVKDQATFLDTAYALENTGVHAYLGQAGNLKSKALLGAAASIVTIEARHAAAVATLRGGSPFSVGKRNSITPDGAFDRPYSKGRVLKIVGKTGFIKS